MVTHRQWDWQVAIFGQNEAPVIGRCLRAIAAAAGGRRILATVILNGTTDDGARQALQAAAACGLPADIHLIAHADKSNAINRSLRELLAQAGNHAFVDAYAAIGPDSFGAFETALARDPAILAVSGIGTTGRSTLQANRQALQTGGVLRGQLHCLRRDFIERLAARGLRLPVGLYRGDGLLGSMAAHDLDPLGSPWVDARIAGAAGASFTVERLSPFRPADLRRQFRRKIRQMRGRLETEAIKDIIYQRGYEALPGFADDMITAWLARHGAPLVSIQDRPFLALALRQHARAVRPEAAALTPVLSASFRC